jgi:hypothetical protein
VLKQQADTLRDLGNAYSFVGEKAKNAFSYNGRNSVGLSAESSINELRLSLASSIGDVTGGAGRMINPGKSAGGYFQANPEFAEFADAIEHLQKTAKAGIPDVIGFKAMIESRWALDPNNAALTAAAVKLQELAKDSVSAARALKELQAAQEQLARSVGPGGLPLRRGSLSTESMGAFETTSGSTGSNASAATKLRGLTHSAWWLGRRTRYTRLPGASKRRSTTTTSRRMNVPIASVSKALRRLVRLSTP